MTAFVPFRKNQSMYHAMGYSSILVMQAGMTFDPKDMDAAMTSLRESLQTCERFQKLHIRVNKRSGCCFYIQHWDNMWYNMWYIPDFLELMHW